jgi:pyruvate dehydrogenase E2 component (dihydrolipoamide acetyltransferase)
MALNMARAHAEVARTTVVDEADIDAWGADQNPTVRLVRAVVHAAKREPALNAWYDARTTSRLVHENVDLGVAVDSKDALYVPVVRDAGALDAAALRAAITELRRKAEQHAFQPADLHGATLTLSNFGTIAGRFAALMVMPPQVAIVGAGRIEPRVVASPSGPMVHRVLPISLTFDHRCVLGAEAARFLRALVEDLVREA